MEYQLMKQYHLIRYYQIHSNHSQKSSTRRSTSEQKPFIIIVEPYSTHLQRLPRENHTGS
eukprot:3470434-Amphidinium_carterae.1